MTLEERFLKAPAEDRKLLTTTVLATFNQVRLNHQDLNTLFLFWNTYIQPSEPMDVNCGNCRTEVVTRLRVLIRDVIRGN
jgi:hypothetical protein